MNKEDESSSLKMIEFINICQPSKAKAGTWLILALRISLFDWVGGSSFCLNNVTCHRVIATN